MIFNRASQSSPIEEQAAQSKILEKDTTDSTDRTCFYQTLGGRDSDDER
jgi:hypothetical protein